MNFLADRVTKFWKLHREEKRQDTLSDDRDLRFFSTAFYSIC